MCRNERGAKAQATRRDMLPRPQVCLDQRKNAKRKKAQREAQGCKKKASAKEIRYQFDISSYLNDKECYQR